MSCYLQQTHAKQLRKPPTRCIICSVHVVIVSRALYVLFLGGFSAAKKNKVEIRRLLLAAGDCEPASLLPSPRQTTISFGLSTHRSFMVFTLFCQGLFAGVALWHIISVHFFVSQGYHVVLQQYGKLAKPVESFYYLMFALCTVAAFDRYVDLFLLQ